MCFNYYSKDKKVNISRETRFFLFLERKKNKNSSRVFDAKFDMSFYLLMQLYYLNECFT